RKYKAIGAGNGNHTCATALDDAIWCWGANVFGEIGDGTVGYVTTPTQTSGAISFKAIEAGEYHVCGVSTAGSAFCWGDATDGRIGNGAVIEQTTPATVNASGVSFNTISSGYYAG